MRWKVYQDDRCPHCGRDESSERVRRNRFIKLFFSDAKLMRCRLCLSRFLVRNASSEIPPA
jgi:DNA-directed RNA polymerase subunit RPC12/RpoP